MPMNTPFLSIALLLAATPALAQDSSPPSTITGATWEQYQKEYLQSPLCSQEEITLWTCSVRSRVYSLCASRTVTRTSGYLQYRAATRGKVTFTYPADKKPPFGLFTYSPTANGDASVSFTNQGYEYTLFDSLRGASSILVTAAAPSGKSTEITCPGNQTLQVNYTMRLMYDSGVWARD